MLNSLAAWLKVRFTRLCTAVGNEFRVVCSVHASSLENNCQKTEFTLIIKK